MIHVTKKYAKKLKKTRFYEVFFVIYFNINSGLWCFFNVHINCRFNAKSLTVSAVKNKQFLSTLVFHLLISIFDTN